MTLTQNTFTINTINSKKINVKVLNNIKRYIAPTDSVGDNLLWVVEENRKEEWTDPRPKNRYEY